VLLTIITLAIYTLRSGKNLLQSRLDLNSADSDLANSLVDVFNNFEAIKIYKAEKETSLKFTLIADKYAAEAINFQDHQSRIKLIQQIIVSIGGGIIYLYLFNLAVKKEISAGDLVMVVSFCHQAFGPATFISGIWQELKKCSIDLKPLLSLMPNNTDVFPKPSSSNQSLLEVCGQLELHQVSLNIGNRQILNNINFRVDSRSLVILCGRSGSGKSTILRLIARLYEPSKGEITLDNVTISDFSLDIYRDSVLLVPQETFLQQATIRDNIKLGLNSLSEQQIRDAAEAAGIHDFIVSLNDGYDTLVGNKGLDLSGGQRQRICLARALARTPKILLLDEPFSALDPLTAHELFSTIKSISKTCTCIITSHHAEYAVEADSVILLRDGTIHAMGQHQELLKSSPHYMNLFGSIS
jgi:ATP-binding cassette subfamily B protein